ncbi:MAG: SRPBCC domain-containing protein [Bacteroidota bacterium]|nr:SRPBCC domain-containing protein [Bacteroidota bacterium]
MRSLDTQIIINAPCHIIWHHLTDFSSFSEWNEFIPHIQGQLLSGARLSVKICPPGGKPMNFKPTITLYENGRILQWLGHLGIRGLFDGQHTFMCESTGAESSSFIHKENFTGILVPLVWKSIHAKTLKGFELMNQQLKARAENHAWGK